MRLKSINKFDGDYLLLRRAVLIGKISAKSAKDWIKTKGEATKERAIIEADHLARRHSKQRKHINEEDNWKNEMVKIYQGDKE
jgi:hypothetical protein